jgi:hypothetical protein
MTSSLRLHDTEATALGTLAVHGVKLVPGSVTPATQSQAGVICNYPQILDSSRLVACDPCVTRDSLRAPTFHLYLPDPIERTFPPLRFAISESHFWSNRFSMSSNAGRCASGITLARSRLESRYGLMNA